MAMNSLRMQLRSGAPKDTTIGSPSGSYKTWFNQKGTSLERFVPKDPGVYYFNIMPWMGADGKAHDLLYAWVHRSIGPEKGDYLCLGRGTCPCCAEADKVDETDHDAALNLFAKERVLMIVQPVGPNGPMPLAFFETAARGKSSFITHLKAAQDVALKKTWIADPDEGPMLSVLFQKAEFGGHSFLEVARVDLLPRQFEITDEVLSSVPNPETWKIRPTTAEMEAALYGGLESSDETPNTQEAPARQLQGNDGRPFQDPFPDQPTAYTHVGPTPAPQWPAAQRTESPAPAAPADQYQAQQAPIPQWSQNAQQTPRPFPPAPQDQQIPQQPAPDSRQMQAASQPSAPAPTMPAPSAPAAGDCPKGYRFGVDCDALPLCSRCPDAVYDKCKRAMKR